MRYIILLLGLILPLLTFAQEEIQYKTYSYSELFQMIEEEEDSVFKLSYAKIIFDPKTDSSFAFKEKQGGFLPIEGSRTDTLHIYKSINFQNIDFDGPIGFHLVFFHESVSIKDSQYLLILNSTFEKKVEILNLAKRSLEGMYGTTILDSKFQAKTTIRLAHTNGSSLAIFNSSFYGKRTEIAHFGEGIFSLRSNRLSSDNTFIRGVSRLAQYTFGNKSNLELIDNNFNGSKLSLELETMGIEYLKIAKNRTNKKIELRIDGFNAESNWINWELFKSGIFDSEIFDYWMTNSGSDFFDRKGYVPEDKLLSDRNIKYYFDTVRVQDVDVYNAEVAIRDEFFDYFNDKHDTENANLVYIEIKDLETERLAFLYEQTPNFKSFFTWKINQFLKTFSAYGTEPARAIIFSMYVILAFALVYLFFPNHWDSHGKNRIMDRYRFFTKYMKRDSGMHEVYLEEKNQELMASEDFKSYMLESEKGVPKFFMATALPLYRWSVAGTKSASWLLSKVDVLKGKWSETEDSKKGGKSFLLITAFLIALLYDIFIKMLNALMLSINTFTTLGFGEIPIKGLPRYLAIIQGFIGWFMLTIFSVSLISQLLN